jgi:ABC-type multidrug transport system fused ATPase/permease subunit
MRILLRIVGHAFRHKRFLFLAWASVIGVTASSLAIPRLIGTAVDTIFNSTSDAKWSALIGLSIAILVANVLRGAFAYGQNFLGESTAERVAYDIRNEFYDHLQHLSFAYHDKEQTGDLMSKATADVQAIRMFVQAGMIRSWHNILLLVAVSSLLALLSWELTVLTLLFIPPILWRCGRVVIQLRRQWLAVQTELGLMTTVLQENLSGQRVVKAFAADAYEKEKFQNRAGNVAYHTYEAAKLEATNTAMMSIYYVGATGLVLWVGGREVISGAMTVGDLTQFVFYLGLLAMPIRMAAMVVNSFARAVSAGQRIFAVLDARSAVQEKPDAAIIPRGRGHVVFGGVSFGYHKEAPVLRSIEFEAKPEQVIAILGAPGSGKSSIVHLIPRFYDVTAGAIIIDGVDVRDATLASLRANVGIVQQDVFLFTDSIRENIIYGAANASDERVKEAATVAQLHDFIVSLPEGYDTWVGERGTTLSGGQRQRLAIARTLLLDPPILILDDSTSSVDTETEHRIQRALVEVMKGRTTFVIAHRLSTLKTADLVLVLDKGEIVQRGTHEELFGQTGLYRDIYELQLRPQEGVTVNGQQPVGVAADPSSTAALPQGGA